MWKGEWINQFISNGFDGYGCDVSEYSSKTIPKGKFYKFDILKDPIPFSDENFDIIFTKSFIEHFHYPEEIIKICYKLLKRWNFDALTPEWQYHYKDFYDDYTHRTPFSKTSLTDIQLIHNFNEVKVESLKQLPSTWGKYKFLANPFSEIVRLFTPDSFKN